MGWRSPKIVVFIIGLGWTELDWTGLGNWSFLFLFLFLFLFKGVLIFSVSRAFGSWRLDSLDSLLEIFFPFFFFSYSMD